MPAMPTCTRRIFTERLPDLVAPSARKTQRLITVLRAIGLALGGQAGARLAARLRLPTSPATLLRLVRAAPMPQSPALQAVGVDEWAWRRGHRYGTILVDLADTPCRGPAAGPLGRQRGGLAGPASDDHRRLPRSQRPLCRRHSPGGARGRAGGRSLPSRPEPPPSLGSLPARPPTGAPGRRRRDGHGAHPAHGLVPVTPMYRGRRRSPKPAPPPDERPPRHARWVAIYEAVHTLRAQGTPIAIMARQLGISRPTVYAYLRRDTPPGPRRLQRPPSARVLTPYVPYLIRRWRESGADSRQLWREIQALGYTHSARTVGRFITRLRRAADAGYPPESQRSPYTRPQGPSARAVSFVMVCPAAKRSADAQTYLDQLCQVEAALRGRMRLSQAFLAMVRERRGSDVEAWMAEATAQRHRGAGPLRPGAAGGPGRGHRGAHPGVEQRPRGGADHPTEAAQAPGLWPDGLLAAPPAHLAGRLAAIR